MAWGDAIMSDKERFNRINNIRLQMHMQGFVNMAKGNGNWPRRKRKRIKMIIHNALLPRIPSIKNLKWDINKNGMVRVNKHIDLSGTHYDHYN